MFDSRGSEDFTVCDILQRTLRSQFMLMKIGMLIPISRSFDKKINVTIRTMMIIIIITQK